MRHWGQIRSLDDLAFESYFRPQSRSRLGHVQQRVNNRQSSWLFAEFRVHSHRGRAGVLQSRHSFTPPKRLIAQIATGPLPSQVDRVWAASWSCGISVLVFVIEEIAHVFFFRRLAEPQSGQANKAQETGRPLEHRMLIPMRDAAMSRNRLAIGVGIDG